MWKSPGDSGLFPVSTYELFSICFEVSNEANRQERWFVVDHSYHEVHRLKGEFHNILKWFLLGDENNFEYPFSRVAQNLRWDEGKPISRVPPRTEEVLQKALKSAPKELRARVIIGKEE